MKLHADQTTSRRQFLKDTSRLAAASALAGVALPHVHAAEDNTIRLALIGCGGRGSGAVANAMSAGGLVLGDDGGTKRAQLSGAGGPVKLVAMADIRQDKLDQSYNALSQALSDWIDVPPERRFLGFDAYRHAIDCLRPGDVAMLTTHAAFRAPHLEYAVQKGVNVFMEKDFAPDPGGIKRILRAGEAAEKKNLKIAAGLMCRHSSARQALIQKIRDGAMGDIQLIRAYRMDSGYVMAAVPARRERAALATQPRPSLPVHVVLRRRVHRADDPPDGRVLLDQGRLAGVGPRRRRALRRQHRLQPEPGQLLHRIHLRRRHQGPGRRAATSRIATPTSPPIVHGTKCAAKFSGNIHAPTSWLYKDQRTEQSNIAWRVPKETVNPWQAEWDVLLSAIRQRQAAQRDPARRSLEPRRHHGPGRGAYGQDRDVGGSHGLQLPVLLQRG